MNLTNPDKPTNLNTHIKLDKNIPLEMYHVPGFEQIDIKKYLRDKSQDQAIRIQSEKSKITLLDKFKSVPKSELPILIEKALASQDPADWKVAVEWIPDLQGDQLSTLICQALKKPDVFIQKSVAQWILNLPTIQALVARNLISKNIQEALNQANQTDKPISVDIISMIKYAPKADRPTLIRLVLDQANSAGKQEAVGQIQFVLDTEEASLLIEESLSSPDLEVQYLAARMISDLPDSYQLGLRNIVTKKVKEALNQADPKLMQLTARMISFVGDEKPVLEELVLEKIREIFGKEDLTSWETGVKLIAFAPKNQRSNLIREALRKSDVEIQKAVVRLILTAEQTDQVGLIRQALNNPDVEVQLAATNLILFVRPSDRTILIRQAINSPDIEVQKAAVELIWTVPADERSSLFDESISKGLGNEIIKPPLYTKHPQMNSSDFSRRDFEKTGSRTTLLGGELKDKLIIRHLNPTAFLVWQTLYEDYQMWQSAGFQYVPIEPIQSYRLNKATGLVDVYTGVLDLNLSDWYEMSGMKFNSELENQKQLIIACLEAKNIRHGHHHNRNFSLRFFRDENGMPNFNKIPRLYLIDFDMASSA